MDSERVVVRVARPELDALDAYRAAEDDNPTRPEALRRILRDWLREHGYLEDTAG